jgi:subtilisin family serine protease
MPPGEQLWTYWFGTGNGAADPAQQAELLDALDEAIEQRITLLLDAGAVVVAAAGNDGFRATKESQDPVHPQPRLPADYDSVLCVVAADRAATIAAYSNRGDLPFTGNCVAVYGGQGKEERYSANEVVAVVPKVAGQGDEYDGVVGLYTGFAPKDGQGTEPPNGGWAYWSGTSFATPIISGIAANLLARNELGRRNDASVPRLTPRQVMSQILRMAEPGSDPDFGCPYVPVTQRKLLE